MSTLFRTALIAFAACLTACGGSNGSGGDANVPPTPPPVNSACTTPTVNGGVFSQTTDSLGLCYSVQQQVASTNMQVMGGGLAMSDVNRDGFLDLYVTHGRHSEGELYIGGATGFAKSADNNGIAPNGLETSGYFIDLDSDGWDDFVSIQYQANSVQIFMNNQAGRFSDETSSAGIFLQKPTFSLAAADYDLDGDVDLFFAHWGWLWRETEPVTEYLWENDGSGFFTDVSSKVEIIPTLPPVLGADEFFEHSFTPIFADVNSDGYPDILLAGDFESSQVLINNAGVSFTDATTDAISDENGMGATVADYDNDGDLDWFVSSIHNTGREKQYIGGESGNRLYANDGNGVFTDVTDGAGVRAGAWGWGACFADFDNDGSIDIFHTNGMTSLDSNEDDPNDPLAAFFRDTSRLFMSQGDGTFAEMSNTLGINHDDQGRGVICTDYDKDGWIDILIATNGKSPTVYRNEFSNSNHYLQIDLEGPPGNREGIGARVTVETASGTQMREVVLGSNYLSQQPCTLHIGLGADTEVLSVTVKWPGIAGQETRLENIAVDQRVVVAAP